jgi:hypothetical protein
VKSKVLRDIKAKSLPAAHRSPQAKGESFTRPFAEGVPLNFRRCGNRHSSKVRSNRETPHARSDQYITSDGRTEIGGVGGRVENNCE